MSRSDIAGLGVLVAQALSGRTGEVDELRHALPGPIARIIDRATDGDSIGTYESVDDLVGDLHEALAEDVGSPAPRLESPTPVDNPYKGLRSFDAVDAVDFFGRERLVERLIARLGGSGTRGRFIAVVGPSGSGKSSAVKAGLLPAIRRGALPAVRFVVHDRDDPGNPSVRTARGRPLERRRQPPAVAARAARRRPGAAARGQPGVARRRLATAAAHRPVRGALHTGRHGDGQPVPRRPGQRRHRRAESHPRRSSRFAPTSTTGRCSTEVSASCSATGPRSSLR